MVEIKYDENNNVAFLVINGVSMGGKVVINFKNIDTLIKDLEKVKKRIKEKNRLF